MKIQSHREPRSLFPTVLAAVVPLVLGACGTPGDGVRSPGRDTGEDPVEELPVFGEAGTLELATWNLEWFGDRRRGPSDEQLQLENVRRVISALDVDLWSVQEVVDREHFEELVSALPGYSGFLADDSLVSRGAEYYRDFDDGEQKVGIIYREDMFTVRGARVILTDENHAFAGRPPVEVRLSVDAAGAAGELVVILLHAKAGSGHDDRARRVVASAALAAYLDATWPEAAVAVVGDFNDDVDTSITEGLASSYANFVADPDYEFPTAALSAEGLSSTVFYPDVVDHHLASDDFFAAYVEGSADVVPLEAYLEEYGETTSDHYPVLTRWDLPGETWPAGGF